MRPLVYSEPVYRILFAIALIIWIIPERLGAFWLRSGRDHSARRQDRGSYYLLIAAFAVGLVAAFSLAINWPGAAMLWFRPQVTIAGIVLMLLGVALRWWSIVVLGHYFTLDVAVRATQAVVQSGPYRLIRHPGYSAMLLTVFGVGLALANWASLVALLACALAGLLYRVRIEERALTAALGQPYLDYMRRTTRFIPFIV